MALTLTAAQLAAAVRLGDSTEETAEATRLLAFVTEAVTRHAPDAPAVVQDEAAVRLAGYLFDMPNAGRGAGFADTLRNSGALSVLLPYRQHRAGSTAAAVAAAQAAIGTVGNPVTGVSITGDELAITFADGSVVTLTLPTGGDGTDQAARDAAASNTLAIELNAVGIESNVQAIAGIGSPVDSDARAAAAVNAVEIAVLEPLAVSNRNRVGALEPVVAELTDAALVDLYITNSGAQIVGIQHDTGTEILHDLPDTVRPQAWAQRNNVEPIPAEKLTNAPGGGTGTPVSTAILEPFVERYALKGNTDEIDDARLPPARLVPDPSSATDGQVAKVQGGAWTIGDDAEGTPGGGGALTANTIASLPRAPDLAVHSRAVFAGVFDSDLFRYEFGHVIRLMRSTAGLGRQINPGGNTANLGKVPVVHADGVDFHYLLQKPAELPTIASNAPTNTAHMNPAILYKDTAEGETADAVYYKRKHDRESVIIAMNDTSPRSFGTEHRSYGWTNRIILDTAEPVPGVTPYPSAPPHWEAFIRSQNIASGLYEWRLYTDEMFTSLDTIYLDMRDQDDPDTHIQNVAMSKPVNEAYWTSGTYTFDTFPFYGIAGRLARPIIRIRNADDTLSTSIIHLIPVADVKERIVDEDRLHGVYADLLDQIDERSGGATVTRYSLPMPSASYIHRTGGAHYFPAGESIWTIPYPAGTTLAGMSAAFKTAVLQSDFQHASISDVGVAATEALPTQLWGTHTHGGGTGFRIVFAAGGISLALPSAAVLPANERDGWIIRLSVVT